MEYGLWYINITLAVFFHEGGDSASILDQNLSQTEHFRGNQHVGSIW